MPALPSPQASDASGTGLYDLAAGRWDTSRLAALGDRAASCRPELVGPNEVRPRWRRFAGGGNCRSCCLAGLPPASWAAQAGAPSPSRVGCALNYATTQLQTTSKPRMPCAPFPSQHRPTDWSHQRGAGPLCCWQRADLHAAALLVQVVGTLRPEVAAELRLPPTVQVAPGGGDNAMAALGAGAVKEGSWVLSLGTSGGSGAGWEGS